MVEVLENAWTLDSILTTMDQLDAGLLNLNIDEMGELGAALSTKTDAYKSVLDRIEFRSFELKSQIDELITLRRALEAKHDQIRKRMADVMTIHSIDRLPGKVWTARLSTSKALEFDPGREKPTVDDLELFPSWVNMELSWNKAEIKREMAIGVGHCPGAKISERKSVVFKAAKE